MISKKKTKKSFLLIFPPLYRLPSLKKISSTQLLNVPGNIILIFETLVNKIVYFRFNIKLKEIVKNTCILGTFVILSLLQKFFCIYFSMWEGS